MLPAVLTSRSLGEPSFESLCSGIPKMTNLSVWPQFHFKKIYHKYIMKVMDIPDFEHNQKALFLNITVIFRKNSIHTNYFSTCNDIDICYKNKYKYMIMY